MAEFDYRQRPPTKEFESNYERIFGERCKKHRLVKLDEEGMCPACEQAWEEKLERYEESGTL